MKRRMLCTDIISEGKFLRMSMTAQGLYMHLLGNADDDGCVDAYTIMRMVGGKEDDLVLLKERGYITILDEQEFILWITNWQEFNWIDARIKQDSPHLPLLLAKVKGLEIVESKRAEANKARYERLKRERQAKLQQGNIHDPHEEHMLIPGETPDKERKGKLSRDNTYPLRGEKGKGEMSEDIPVEDIPEIDISSIDFPTR